MVALRRIAERLRNVADGRRLAQSWQEWRDHVHGEKCSRELLQRGRAELAVRRQCQVCSALMWMCKGC